MEKYEELMVEICMFGADDIVAASGFTLDDEELPPACGSVTS